MDLCPHEATEFYKSTEQLYRVSHYFKCCHYHPPRSFGYKAPADKVEPVTREVFVISAVHEF